MKELVMLPWVAEAINTKEENDILITGLAMDLKGTEPGQNAVSIGGDTLVFAVVEGDGQTLIYECTIRRASELASLEQLPDGYTHSLQKQDRPS